MRSRGLLIVGTVFPVLLGVALAGEVTVGASNYSATASPTPTHYIYEGSPISLQLDAGRLAIKFKAKSSSLDHAAALTSTGLAAADLEATGVVDWQLARVATPLTDPAELNTRLERVLESSAVEFVSPVFLQPNGGWMIVTPDILVRFRSDYREDARPILKAYDTAAEIVADEFGGMAGAYKWHSLSGNGFEVLALANRLATDPRVEWAEPDMQATIDKHLEPNDPGWYELWGLNNTGQYGGVADMDMDADLAWDISTGNDDVLVLVLDDGVELTHPDLNIAAGGDFTGGGSGGGPGNNCDNHGTAVAGCVSAIINNGLGSIGAAPNCQVLAAKVSISNVPCDGSSTFQFSWFVNALAWGENRGARVSNTSSGFSPSSSITAKYASTYANGMVHFAAAGNSGNEGVSYPSSLPSVNAVGALTRWGTRASFSQYGAGLSLSAPGQTIYTTDRTGVVGYTSGDYTYADGTSFASPYAAGVAALLLSVDPWLTATEVESQLQTTAVDLGDPGFDNIYGHGFINAYNAIEHAAINLTADVVLGPAPLTVNFTGSTGREVTSWEWDFGDDEVSADQNPTHEYQTPGMHTVTTTILTQDWSFSKDLPGGVSVYADTLRILEGRFAGGIGQVDVYVRNYLPLKSIEIPVVYEGAVDIYFDSVATTGWRSEFMSAALESRVDNWHTVSVTLSTDVEPYLEPGSGPVASLFFTNLQPWLLGTVPVEITSYPHHSLVFETYAGTYVPVWEDGSIKISCCEGIVGDVNGVGEDEPTIGDVSSLIDHLFISGASVGCYLEADANQSGGTSPTAADLTIGDVSVLIDHLFISGIPLADCL